MHPCPQSSSAPFPERQYRMASAQGAADEAAPRPAGASPEATQIVNAPTGRGSTRTLVQLLDSWVLLVPGALTLARACRAGGFFAQIAGSAAALLCVLLLLRITSARRPFEGWSAPLASASVALPASAPWT